MKNKPLTDMTPIKVLRLLTGAISFKEPAEISEFINLLSFVNLIARYLDNDGLLEESFLRTQFERIGVNLILDDKKNE